MNCAVKSKLCIKKPTGVIYPLSASLLSNLTFSTIWMSYFFSEQWAKTCFCPGVQHWRMILFLYQIVQRIDRDARVGTEKCFLHSSQTRIWLRFTSNELWYEVLKVVCNTFLEFCYVLEVFRKRKTILAYDQCLTTCTHATHRIVYSVWNLNQRKENRGYCLTKGYAY